MNDTTSKYTHTNAVSDAVASDSAAPDEAVESILNEAAGSAETAQVEEILIDPLEELRTQLAAEQQRNAELNDRFQRSAAEFQNTLRRREKQTGETIERASQQVVLKLLPILDDFDRAFQNLPDGVSAEHVPWLEGFQQILKKLQQVLEDEGVTVIPLDGAFDPTLHEAISSEPSETVESGHIIATLRVGYQQRGRVIRPALVRVAA